MQQSVDESPSKLPEAVSVQQCVYCALWTRPRVLRSTYIIHSPSSLLSVLTRSDLDRYTPARDRNVQILDEDIQRSSTHWEAPLLSSALASQKYAVQITTVYDGTDEKTGECKELGGTYAAVVSGDALIAR